MLETDVPTRAEIAGILGTIKPEKGLAQEKAERNIQRRSAVQSTIPVEIFTQIESDLTSYPEWEKEEDDEQDET